MRTTSITLYHFLFSWMMVNVSTLAIELYVSRIKFSHKLCIVLSRDTHLIFNMNCNIIFWHLGLIPFFLLFVYYSWCEKWELSWFDDSNECISFNVRIYVDCESIVFYYNMILKSFRTSFIVRWVLCSFTTATVAIEAKGKCKGRWYEYILYANEFDWNCTWESVWSMDCVRLYA